MDTLSGEATLPKLFFFPSGKGSTLKGNSYLNCWGANSFLTSGPLFIRGLVYREAKMKYRKLVLLPKMVENLPDALFQLNCCLKINPVILSTFTTY